MGNEDQRVAFILWWCDWVGGENERWAGNKRIFIFNKRPVW